jgi:hypothetical protein
LVTPFSFSVSPRKTIRSATIDRGGPMPTFPADGTHD